MIFAIFCLFDVLGTWLTAEAAQLVTGAFSSKICYNDRVSKLLYGIKLSNIASAVYVKPRYGSEKSG
jgi:hypothetical protein